MLRLNKKRPTQKENRCNKRFLFVSAVSQNFYIKNTKEDNV